MFQCFICDYSCSRKSNFTKHVLTRKHQNRTILNDEVAKVAKVAKKVAKASDSTQQQFPCEKCDKLYFARNSLWYHKKKCKIITSNNPPSHDNSVGNDVVVAALIKETSYLREIILDVCQKIQPFQSNTTNNNNITSHKTFNLQFFLNETCKDAMNIMDFVESIKFQLSDLEQLGQIGYVQGISNIIVKNLNSLDQTQRPIHCTDSKREVMYVKDDNKWEKENDDNKKLRKVIKHVAHKNSKLLNDFKAKHPDCDQSQSRYADKFNSLIIEAMGGRGDNDCEKENKIIKHIMREVTIDK